jgi:DNA polymerase III gamma/tau subunit
LNSHEVEEIKKANLQKPLLAEFLTKILEFYPEIKNAANPYLWVELMILQLCNINDNKQSSPAFEAKENIAKPTVKTPQKSAAKPVETTKVLQEPIPAQKTEIPEEIQDKVDKTLEEPKEEAREENVVEESQSALNTNIQEAWNMIVNSIETIPARCFFSSVAKLVEMDESSMTLGFLNPVVLSQAKHDLKAKPLEDAIKKVFENGLRVNYIQITKDTPFLEANIQTAAPSVCKNYSEPNSQGTETEEFTNTKERPKNSEKEVFSRVYTAKTKEMVESFNGKVID